jgi:hypothetical protein
MDASMGNFYQTYPVVESLTPELQRISHFLLVSLHCAFVDFAAEDSVMPSLGVNL